MSKQIQFLILEKDGFLIENHLKQEGYSLIAAKSASAMPFFYKNLSEKNILNVSSKKYLVHKNHIENISFRPLSENLFKIDDLKCNVIELSTGFGGERETLKRGRLYFETGYYENGLWIEKNAEFLKAADKLFRWFKKTFKKVDEEPFRGSYTSDGVIEWVRQGGKIAID